MLKESMEFCIRQIPIGFCIVSASLDCGKYIYLGHIISLEM